MTLDFNVQYSTTCSNILSQASYGETAKKESQSKESLCMNLMKQIGKAHELFLVKACVVLNTFICQCPRVLLLDSMESMRDAIDLVQGQIKSLFL